MAKKKTDYSIRTLTYYQMEGGVYNDIITAIQRLRREPQFSRLMPPNQILNKATDLYDYTITLEDEEINIQPENADDLISIIGEAYMDHVGMMEYRVKVEDVIIAVYACLLSQRPFFHKCIDGLFAFVEEKTINKYFYPIAQGNIASNPKPIDILVLEKENEALHQTLKDKDEIIASQGSVIAIQSQTLDNHLSVISDLTKRLALAEQSSYEGSTFDRLLTLDSILDWIRGRHHYNYTEQVFRMLADFKDKVATDEERRKIHDLENEMLDRNQVQAVFNQNFALNSNMMTGMVSNPQLPIGMTPAEVQQLICQFLNNLSNG